MLTRRQIDWQKVADEAGIISKGAAYVVSACTPPATQQLLTIHNSNKRFSRMKIRLEGEEGGSPTKATTPAANGEDESPKKTPAKRTPAKKTPNKKRKLEEAVEEVEEKPVKGEEEEVCFPVNLRNTIEELTLMAAQEA